MKSAYKRMTAAMLTVTLTVTIALSMMAIVTAAPAAAMTGEGRESRAEVVLQDEAKVVLRDEEVALLQDEIIVSLQDEEDDEEAPRMSNTSLSMKAGQEVSVSVSHGVVKTWQSSNTKVVKVKNGLLTALKKGSAVITATLTTGKKLECNVKVTTSPKLSKSSVTVKRGKTTKVKITGKADSVKNLYKNTSIAKITSKKTASTLKVKGLKRGSTTLKVRVNGVWLKLKVKVK